MFSFSRSALVAALLMLFLQPIVFGDDTKAPAIRPELAAADQLYRAGKFAEAEASYQALLKTDAKLVPAQVGIVRAMLRQQKIDESLDAVNNALTAQPNSAALLKACPSENLLRTIYEISGPVLVRATNIKTNKREHRSAP